MYETLSGQRTTLQQIKKNNFITNLCSNLTNSNHSFISKSIIDHNNFTMKKFNNILTIRNNRYKNNFVNINARVGYNTIDVADLYKNQKSIQLNQKYNRQSGDEALQKLIQQICQYSIDSEIKIQVEGYQRRQQEKILKNINKDFISLSKEQNRQIDGRGIKLIKLVDCKDIFLRQLVRNLQIIQQSGDITILIIAKILTKHIEKQKIYSKLISQALQIPSQDPNQTNNKKIYYLFLAEQPSNRILLSRYLYQLNQQNIYKLITQYDQLFQQNNNITLQQIYQFQQKFKKYRQNMKILKKQVGIQIKSQDKHGYDYLDCLFSVISLDMEIVLPQQLQFEFSILLILMKVFKWTNIKLQKIQQQQKLEKIIHNKFIQTKTIILSYLTDKSQIQPYLLHLYFLSYQSALNLALNCPNFISIPTNKLLLTLLILFQSQSIIKIFNFILISPILIVQHFEQQLCRQIKQLQNKQQIIQVCNQVIFLLKLQDKLQLLLNSKQIVQGVNLSYICGFMDKNQQKQFIKNIIMGSIQIYKNTVSFLNTDLPIDKILPYFQIQILLQGLKSILVLDTFIPQKSKQIFFGMMSVYRGQSIPIQHQLKMTVLQMLFQWFILHQAILQQDYKSLGLSLKCNLEQHQINQQYQIGLSLRLSQSSRIGQPMRVHNYQYIAKIGGNWFIDCLKNHQQYQKLYIAYMYIIAQAIAKIKQSRQKIIKRSKIQLWIQAYLGKINNNLKEARGNLYKKLNNLREKGLKLFAMHSV